MSAETGVREGMSPPTKSQSYYTHLDSLRGIAAVIVCLFHVNWTNHITKNAFIGYGAIFVDFFFVLSGIIMSHVYPSLREKKGISIFLQRRFARLYPLHLATLLALSLAFAAVYFCLPHMWAKLAHLDQLQNLIPKFFANLFLLNAHGLTDSESFNAPSWSIGAEATCYLLFGAVGLFAFGKRYFVYAAIVVASAVAFWAFGRNIVTFQNDFGVIRGLFGFFLGCLVYACWIRANDGKGDHGILLPVALSIVICVAISYARVMPDWTSIGFPILFGLLLYVLIEPDRRIKAFLSAKPLRLLGALSYSIYLIHFLVRWLIGAIIILKLHAPYTKTKFHISATTGDVFVVLYISLVLAASWVSYTYFENPMRKLLRGGSKRSAPQVAGDVPRAATPE